jgi:hypothetical protein
MLPETAIEPSGPTHRPRHPLGVAADPIAFPSETPQSVASIKGGHKTVRPAKENLGIVIAFLQGSKKGNKIPGVRVTCFLY